MHEQLRKLIEADTAAEEERKNEARRPGAVGAPVKRRVSFSERPAVHDVYPRAMYDRTTPEWVDGNFTAVC